MLPEIQNIVAAQLHKAPAAVTPSATFASLGADDLDLAEIALAVEEKMGIVIPDDALIKAAGGPQDSELATRLTVRAFADAAAAAPKLPAPDSTPAPRPSK